MSSATTFSSQTRMHLIDTIPKNACCKASLKYGIELFLKNDEDHFSRFQDPYEREKIDEFIQKLKPSEKSKKKLFELINDSETSFDEDAIINDSIFKCTSCKSSACEAGLLWITIIILKEDTGICLTN